MLALLEFEPRVAPLPPSIYGKIVIIRCSYGFDKKNQTNQHIAGVPRATVQKYSKSPYTGKVLDAVNILKI